MGRRDTTTSARKGMVVGIVNRASKWDRVVGLSDPAHQLFVKARERGGGVKTGTARLTERVAQCLWQGGGGGGLDLFGCVPFFEECMLCVFSNVITVRNMLRDGVQNSPVTKNCPVAER